MGNSRLKASKSARPRKRCKSKLFPFEGNLATDLSLFCCGKDPPGVRRNSAMPSGGRRLPPWTSPRGAATKWSPCTPAGALVFGSHVTPPASAGCCSSSSYRVTPPSSGGALVTPLPSCGGCYRPPRAPPALDSPYVRAKQAQVIHHQGQFPRFQGPKLSAALSGSVVCDILRRAG
jgi:hypothetical protein